MEKVWVWWVGGEAPPTQPAGRRRSMALREVVNVAESPGALASRRRAIESDGRRTSVDPSPLDLRFRHSDVTCPTDEAPGA